MHLLARARAMLENVAVSLEKPDALDNVRRSAAMEDVRRLLGLIRGDLRTRTERLEALVIAMAQDHPIPLYLFGGIWGSKTTYTKWCRDGLPHCYVGSKLCAKPSDFFAEVRKRQKPTTRRGRPRRKTGGKSDEQAAKSGT